jgi:Holliday junction resolvase RusA-like endonuclease
MIFTLPKPISVNQLYRYTCRGGFPSHYTSDVGKAWFEEASYLLKPQYNNLAPLKGDISLHIKLYVCGRFDIDNGNKATLDLLTRCGVIEDDSQIVFLQLEKIKVKHKEDQKMEIEVV